MKSMLSVLSGLVIGTSLILGFASCYSWRKAAGSTGEETRGALPPKPLVSKQDTVEVEVLPPARSDTSHMVTMKPAESVIETGKFTVQIGAFESRENAERLQKLAEEQLQKPVQLAVEGSLYKLTVGEFTTKEEAYSYRALLQKQYGSQYSDAWVVPSKK